VFKGAVRPSYVGVGAEPGIATPYLLPQNSRQAIGNA
jgi:hypothetical protein